MTKKILKVGIGSTLILAAGTLLFGSSHQAEQCLLAGLLVVLNLVLVFWSFKQIFLKKSVALAMALIVSKYAVILILFLLAIRSGWRINEGFIVGISAMFPPLYLFLRDHFKSVEATASYNKKKI